MAKGYNVKVTLRECKGNVERMIRRFSKKTKKARILEEVHEKRYYKKPSIVKREQIRRYKRNAYREEQKRIRAQERRNRNK